MQFVYYDFPLGGAHVHSFLAARAARCAGDQDRFWDYHNLLFNRLSDWGTAQNPPVNQFVSFAEQLGLDKDQFSSCLKSDKYQDVVSASRMLGDQLGVNATPTLILNGKRVRAEIGLDWSALKELISAEPGVAAQ